LWGLESYASNQGARWHLAEWRVRAYKAPGLESSAPNCER